MNTTARLITRTAAGAACLAAIIAGATACGTEDGTTATSNTATASQQLASAKANEAVYLQQLHAAAEAAREARAEHADAARWARGYTGDSSTSNGFGDDRRQTIQEAKDDAASGNHPPGFDKGLTGER